VIPKILHFCWFGDRPLPPLAEACVSSWQKYCGHYQIHLWNEDNSDIRSQMARDAVRTKNWAFLSDVIRFDVLYKYGGIYLDVDMEVIRPLDELLNYDAFLGYESPGRINAAIFGAKPQLEFINQCSLALDYHYKSLGKFRPIPEIVTSVANSSDCSNIYIAPPHVFYPYNPFDETKPVKQLLWQDIKSNTLTIHHFQHSWKASVLERAWNKAKILVVFPVKDKIVQFFCAGQA